MAVRAASAHALTAAGACHEFLRDAGAAAGTRIPRLAHLGDDAKQLLRRRHARFDLEQAVLAEFAKRGFAQARALRDRLASEGFRSDALLASTLPRASTIISTIPRSGGTTAGSPRDSAARCLRRTAMRVLVTGATGFVGRHCLSPLVARGAAARS
jgi:hypothetical protein